MVNNKLITIVVSVFNASRTLASCMESILPQLAEDIEFIIIDGASNDGSLAILHQYSKFFTCFISEPDDGIYDAWNKAITRSQGRYITFVGADDILLPGTIAVYRDAIASHPNVEFFSARACLGGVNGRLIGSAWEWRRSRRHMNIAHVGSLHLRELYDRFGLYKASFDIAGDYDFLLRCGESLTTHFINETTVVMGENGISNKSIFKCLKETYQAKLDNKVLNKYLCGYDFIYALAAAYLRIYFRLLTRFKFKHVSGQS